MPVIDVHYKLKNKSILNFDGYAYLYVNGSCEDVEEVAVRGYQEYDGILTAELPREYAGKTVTIKVVVKGNEGGYDEDSTTYTIPKKISHPLCLTDWIINNNYNNDSCWIGSFYVKNIDDSKGYDFKIIEQAIDISGDVKYSTTIDNLHVSPGYTKYVGYGTKYPKSWLRSNLIEYIVVYVYNKTLEQYDSIAYFRVVDYSSIEFDHYAMQGCE